MWRVLNIYFHVEKNCFKIEFWAHEKKAVAISKIGWYSRTFQALNSRLLKFNCCPKLNNFNFSLSSTLMNCVYFDGIEDSHYVLTQTQCPFVLFIYHVGLLVNTCLYCYSCSSNCIWVGLSFFSGVNNLICDEVPLALQNVRQLATLVIF